MRCEGLLQQAVAKRSNVIGAQSPVCLFSFEAGNQLLVHLLIQAIGQFVTVAHDAPSMRSVGVCGEAGSSPIAGCGDLASVAPVNADARMVADRKSCDFRKARSPRRRPSSAPAA